MKKFLHTALCGLLVCVCLGSTALAADTKDSELPDRQGDFYVMVNGEFVTYEDAVPQAKDNRSFLPMAATFSQLGFAQEDMTWSPEGLITASKDDLTIALTLGKKEIVLTKAGVSRTIPTDVAPYVDPATWRTYVPFGLVADALGYNVGWDGDTGAVIIDDVDAILAANAASYTLMNRYLADYHTSDTVQLTGTTSLDGYAAPKDYTPHLILFSLEGPCEMRTDGDGNAQYLADLTAQGSYLADGTDLLKRPCVPDHSLLTFPRSIDVDMRSDLEAGKYFFRSESLRRPQDAPAPEDIWYTLDVIGLLARTDIPDMTYDALRKITAIPDEGSTFEESIEILLKSSKPTSIHHTAGDTLDKLNSIYADDAFEKSGSVYKSETETAQDTSITFTLFRNGTTITGYAMSVHADDASLHISKREQNMDLSMSLSLDTKLYDEEHGLTRSSKVFISFDMNGTFRSGTQLPAPQPAADVAVIPLRTLLAEELSAANITVPALHQEK